MLVTDRAFAPFRRKDFLMRDQTGQPDRWIGWWTLPPAAVISSSVRFAVPDGASSFAIVMRSMISHSGMCLCRLLGEFHQQHGTDAKLGDEAVGAGARNFRRRPERVEIKAGCPDHHVNAGLETGVEFSSGVSGSNELTTTSASARDRRQSFDPAPDRPAGQFQPVGFLDRAADGGSLCGRRPPPTRIMPRAPR